jgi:hypothetical protein
MDPSPQQQWQKAIANSPFAAVKPGEEPQAAVLWAALGGARGLVESLLPGIGFLVVYTLTRDLLWSLSAPATLAIGFILVRIVTRSPVVTAVAGLIGILASAAVALLSGRAEDNFLLGFIVNGIWIVGILISLVIRKPLVGVMAGILVGDSDWRGDVATRRVATAATWLWLGVFSTRLAVQVPLYFAGSVQALAVAKLVLGIPLYAAALWLTWLLMRAVYRGRDLVSQ